MNIALLENQMARVFITIPVDQFEVYGGTKNGNFAVENTDVDNQVVVKIPAQGHKDCGVVRYEIFARNKTTNHEWLVLGGMVKTLDRESTLGGSSVTTPDYYMTVPISENGTVIQGTQIITGIKGERGYSAYEVACQQGFEGTEEEWFESIRQETATLAVEQVTPLMVRAEEAATNASNSETAAGDYAAGASRAEESAEEHAKDAAGSAAEAQAQAEAAEASAEVADEKARAAESSANEAFGYAAQAAAGAAGAQVDATNAANSASQAKASATSADSSKTQAAASATQAATSATDAATSASAAATSATQAAESAELLGDAALKSADNTFTGNNIFNGALGGEGSLYGLPMVSWLGMSHVLKNVELTTEEVKRIFPNHDKMEVVPYIKCSSIRFDQVLTKIKYGFFEITNANTIYSSQPNGVKSDSGEHWVYSESSDLYLYAINLRAKKSFGFFPNYTSSRGMTSFTLTTAKIKEQHVWVYAPKWQKALIRPEYNATYENKLVFELINYPTSFTELTLERECCLSLVNFNLHKCQKVKVTQTRLDKPSILMILNTLPSYDEATMTTIPTCSMYINEELDGDEEIKNALLNLQAPVADGGKGWTIAISGITLSEAATFGLRKMWYVSKEKDDAGKYVDSENQRWSVSAGTVAMRHYETNESIGYEQFASLDDALTEWGLTEIMEIPEEQ